MGKRGRRSQTQLLFLMPLSPPTFFFIHFEK